jgi:hypothetical protein
VNSGGGVWSKDRSKAFSARCLRCFSCLTLPGFCKRWEGKTKKTMEFSTTVPRKCHLCSKWHTDQFRGLSRTSFD